MNKKIVYILPCSGIGKVFGSIGREATYIIVNELRKEKTKIACLPLIVKGKKEIIDAIRENLIITIDGCPLKCSFNDVKGAIGKTPEESILSSDVVKDNRDIKPETDVYPIGKNAKILSRKLAEKVSQKVDELIEKKSESDSNE